MLFFYYAYEKPSLKKKEKYFINDNDKQRFVYFLCDGWLQRQRVNSEPAPLVSTGKLINFLFEGNKRICTTQCFS